MSTPQRILVRGLNWLGDAIMATPALLNLRNGLPDAHISLLSPSKLADLFQGHPALDQVISIPQGQSLFRTARQLREHRFSDALILPNSPRSAFEPWLAGIPRRIGVGTGLRRILLTTAVTPSLYFPRMRKRSVSEIDSLVAAQPKVDGRPNDPYSIESHQSLHYLQLVEAMGVRTSRLSPLVEVTAAEVAAFNARFFINADQGPSIGLNAGAEYGPAKRWPTENFVQTAGLLHDTQPVQFVLFGGRNDLELAKQLIQSLNKRSPAIRITNVAGTTSLRELAAGLKSCAVVLTNDTGPMHLAAAVGTPVIVPFGSTSPELTGPGFPGSHAHSFLKGSAACAPCFRRECPVDFRCMHSIKPEAVTTECQRILRDRALSPQA